MADERYLEPGDLQVLAHAVANKRVCECRISEANAVLNAVTCALREKYKLDEADMVNPVTGLLTKRRSDELSKEGQAEAGPNAVK